MRMARLLVVVKNHDNPATSWPGHPWATFVGKRQLRSRKHGTRVVDPEPATKLSFETLGLPPETFQPDLPSCPFAFKAILR
ncbi:hypothetical protein A6X21_07650 [Planctopirus hydrillae]|uniref:Uncharacterized protein n=1 Tax=Planctopirus hydrillae TaxID=1841610 RepID=A0A1C3E8F7_9PLAN|nr:hypothetical protein A6X21_07650 [Planctopirus hydrillae]